MDSWMSGQGVLPAASDALGFDRVVIYRIDPRAQRIIGSWAQVRTSCEDFFARHGIGAIA